MRKIILLCASLFTMGLLISASPVKAQSWVSPTGNDSASCTQLAPCLTFQGAFSKGGVTQINCLASGSYGAITITSSLTIDCGTGNVGIISPGTNINGITINGTAGIKIVLRHLSLAGFGVNSIGIAVGTGFTTGTLVVEDCVVQGFGSGMIFFSTSGRTLIDIANSRFINNSASGIALDPSGASTIETIALDHVELTGIGTGFFIEQDTGVAAGTIRNSVILGNSADGIFTEAAQVILTVDTSTVNANVGVGIHANSAGSNIDVYSSTIGANGTGVQASAGSIISFGNNGLNGNGANGSFTSTVGLH